MEHPSDLLLKEVQEEAIRVLVEKGYDRAPMIEYFNLVKFAYESLYGDDVDLILRALVAWLNKLPHEIHLRQRLERAKAAQAKAEEEASKNLRSMKQMQTNLKKVQRASKAVIDEKNAELSRATRSLEESQTHKRAIVQRLEQVETTMVPVVELQEAQAEFRRMQQEVQTARARAEALQTVLSEMSEQLHGYREVSQQQSQLIPVLQVTQQSLKTAQEHIQRLEQTLLEERDRYTALVSRVLDFTQESRGMDASSKQFLEIISTSHTQQVGQAHTSARQLSSERQNRIRFLEQLVQGLEDRQRRGESSPQVMSQMIGLFKQAVNDAHDRGEKSALRAEIAQLRAELARAHQELQNRNNQEINRWQQLHREEEEAFRRATGED